MSLSANLSNTSSVGVQSLGIVRDNKREKEKKRKSRTDASLIPLGCVRRLSGGVLLFFLGQRSDVLLVICQRLLSNGEKKKHNRKTMHTVTMADAMEA